MHLKCKIFPMCISEIHFLTLTLNDDYEKHMHKVVGVKTTWGNKGLAPNLLMTQSNPTLRTSCFKSGIRSFTLPADDAAKQHALNL